MKVVISPGNLRVALSVASSAVSPRMATLPVLRHVLLCATPDGGLRVDGTDLETRSWHTVSARVDEAGSVCLPPKPISDLLDAVDGDITISVNEQHKAELVSGRTRIRLAGFDPEEMPVCPSFDTSAWDHTLPADLLMGAVRSVAHAVAPDDSRPTLAGINLCVAGGMLTLAAADGFRLAVRTLEVDAPDLSVIAQGKTLAKAAGMLGAATSARLIVDANESTLLVDSEVGCWAIRLIEGQFPDFNRIIPRDAPIGVTVDRADLLRALSLVQHVEQTTRGNRVWLSIIPDSIEVRASGVDHDQEAEAIIGATLDRGDPIRIGVNERYLREAVGAIGATSVVVEMTAPGTPILVRNANGDRSCLQVTMPMGESR